LSEFARQIPEWVQECRYLGRLVDPLITEVITDAKGNDPTIAEEAMELKFPEV
jgi:hypothetical protein